MTSQLKDFQEATVNYVFDRFFNSENISDRILVADEVGLGKTLVARGIIQKFSNSFKEKGKSKLTVIYFCSNLNIINQNIHKLNVNDKEEVDENSIRRLNDLAIVDPEVISNGFVKLIPLSPNTSIKVSSGGGKYYERAILFHILCRHEVFRKYREKLKTRLCLDVNQKSWNELISKNSKYNTDLRKEIVDKFNVKLKSPNKEYQELICLCEERENNGKEFKKKKRKAIGSLRKLLASICVEFLNPDLIILDEFQRFKHIIDIDVESDEKLVIETIFNNKDIKLLLLSATPYKMYTIQSEAEDGENHFDEFKFIIRFLLNDSEKYNSFLELWSAYSHSLLHLKDNNWAEVKELKGKVENVLRNIICRTERILASDDKNTMVRMASQKDGKTIILKTNELSKLPIQINSTEIENFICTDNMAKALSEHFENIYAPVEYCKSSPYPFSFLDGYQLHNYAQLAIKENKHGFIDCLISNKKAFLTPEEISNYEKLEMPNAKIQYLINDSIKSGGADLLWIPPSLPYYKFEGAYAEKECFSKILIFSAWRMVPKMISGLLSYECERETIKIVNQTAKQNERSPQNKLKFNKDFSSLSFYSLLYPCITLTNLWKPVFETKSISETVDILTSDISSLISKLNVEQYITNPTKQDDDRWILFYMLLLDRRYNMNKVENFVSNEVNNEEMWNWFYSDEEESIAEMYYKKIFTDILFIGSSGTQAENLPASRLFLRSTISKATADKIIPALKELKLGQPPKHIERQLALLTISSPAICAYRALKDYAKNYEFQAFYGAFRIADSFRKFFNKPETTAVVDKFRQKDFPYWKNIIHYCANGNIQSMLDEYIPVLIDREGLWDRNQNEKIAEIIKLLATDIVGLTTSNIQYQTKDSFLEIKKETEKNYKPKTLRCHYAVALNEKSDTQEGVEKRNTNVRNAFNSPFRPFILSTTSVGQEGLDFHFNCRKILHWNLPANPVDFEQREGRINRFKSLAIRQNIAVKYGNKIDQIYDSEVWDRLFEIALKSEKGDKSELVPYWHVEPEHIFIERHVPVTMYSKDVIKLSNLLKTISVYRIALGQPRQEELVNFLLTHLDEQKIKQIQDEILINLSPFYFNQNLIKGMP